MYIYIIYNVYMCGYGYMYICVFLIYILVYCYLCSYTLIYIFLIAEIIGRSLTC